MTTEAIQRYEIQTIGTAGNYSYRITDRLTDSRIATSYIWENAVFIVNALNNVNGADSELAVSRKDAERYHCWLNHWFGDAGNDDLNESVNEAKTSAEMDAVFDRFIALKFKP